MIDFGIQMTQIQNLMDKTQNRLIQNANVNPHDFDKLLALSTECNYAYGKALAHVYLAEYAQMMMDTVSYHSHLDEARGLAEQENYFDLLIKCAQLQGRHSSSLCNESVALSHYLEGLKLAKETKNSMASLLFYQDIAELFVDCGAYLDGEAFYQKAVESLADQPLPNRQFYEQDLFLSLLRLSCICGNIAKSEEYRKYLLQLPYREGNLIMMVGEIRFLILDRKMDEAQRKAEDLMTILSQNTHAVAPLQQVYLDGLELMLKLGNQQWVEWYIQQIKMLYPKLNRKIAIHFNKLQIQYTEQFQLDHPEVYRDFCRVAMEGENANRISTAEIFRSLIALYETAKTQNRMMEQRSDLQIAVTRDELTQIYNRRYYDKLLSKQLQDDRITSLSCMMIDVDYFKDYNDYYGHAKGDHVLTEVASLLESCLPESAYVGRYGGDEFSCLFVNREESALVDFVYRVQEGLKEKKIMHIKNRNGNLLTLSIGIYHETNLQNCDEYQLLNRADQALYQAKEKGRNTYAIYTQGGENHE